MQALRILRGGRLEYMPKITRPAQQFMFDYNQLKRFQIARNQLPPNSIILNNPETLYEKYKMLINSVIAIIIALLIIISALLLNIRFRRRTERELKASQEKLRALAWRLAEVEDKQRKRLSRELHDQVGQNLTILGINLNLLRSLMVGGSSEMVHSKIGDSLTIVKQTTQRIRNVMGSLRSPVLDDYGLVAAIELYGKQCSERAGIAVRIRASEIRPRLDPDVENALFRIVQESITNTIKHASATEVVITVNQDNGKLLLSIEDNGVGFDTGPQKESGRERGWGLTTMSERALALGGSLQVRSSPGLGTQVVVEILTGARTLKGS